MASVSRRTGSPPAVTVRRSEPPVIAADRAVMSGRPLRWMLRAFCTTIPDGSSTSANVSADPTGSSPVSASLSLPLAVGSRPSSPERTPWAVDRRAASVAPPSWATATTIVATPIATSSAASSPSVSRASRRLVEAISRSVGSGTCQSPGSSRYPTPRTVRRRRSRPTFSSLRRRYEMYRSTTFE